MTDAKPRSKSIHDPIHGFITITPLMRTVMDAPEFQRLRDLKQLGAAHYVYPSATHTRFEHSLGVSHLAGVLMESLARQQPVLGITGRDIEITRMAALVHDIGHGPFSHLYDNHVINAGEAEHEARGCLMFRRLVSVHRIALGPEEVEKIVNMIDPPPELIEDWRYQVVANKVCQVDVDKIDYIQRDCSRLGLEFGNACSRLLTAARVCATRRQSPRLGSTVAHQLSWPKKLQYDIFSLFATRYRLHRQVYNHHAVRAHEFHIAEVLRDLKHRGIPFIDLTDSLVTCKLHRGCGGIKDKILRRDVPKMVGEKVLRRLRGGVVSRRHLEIEQEPNPRLILSLILDKVRIGFCSGRTTNPLSCVHYYETKGIEEIPTAHKLDPSAMSFCVPADYQETIVRLYSLDKTAAGMTNAQDFWNKWLEQCGQASEESKLDVNCLYASMDDGI